MVTFVLVGVGFGEVSDRSVELGRVAKICGDGDPVTGAGMGAGERPAAEPGIHLHARRLHVFDHRRHLPVPELP
jgi:hypothetical protein